MSFTNSQKAKKILAPVISGFVIATLLTGCGSGKTAATTQIKQVTDGVEGQSDLIKIRNLLIVKQEDGAGVLVGTLVNLADESDVITSINIEGQEAVVTAQSLDLLKNSPVIFVGDSANADASVVQLNDVIGHRIPVVIKFAKASPVTLDALIVQADGIYADIANMRFKA
jgi:hypothetical protein